jgi:hypothetical protein
MIVDAVPSAEITRARKETETVNNGTHSKIRSILVGVVADHRTLNNTKIMKLKINTTVGILTILA